MSSSVNFNIKSHHYTAIKFFRTASFIILSSVLVSITSFAMEEKPEKASAPVKGQPETYKKDVSSGEWKRAVRGISEKYEMMSKAHIIKEFQKDGTELDEEQNKLLNFMVNDELEKWQRAATSFFIFMKELPARLNRQKLTRESFFESLFDFVTEFEMIYDAVSTASHSFNLQEWPLEKHFLVIQRAWNSYMQYYSAIEKKEFVSSMLLGFSKKHLCKKDDGKDHPVLKHLAYLKDSNGVLLFTIFPHERIEGNLYATYLPYGRKDLNALEERRVFFYNTDGQPTIVENPGYEIRQIDGYVTMTLYSGREGPKPYCLNPGVCIYSEKKFKVYSDAISFGKGDRDEEGIELIRKTPKLLAYEKDDIQHNVIVEDRENLDKRIRELLPPELQTRKMETRPAREIPTSILIHAHTFLSSLLGEAPKGFILLPKTPVENLEAHYVYLLELSEIQKEQLKDPDVLYALSCVENEFPGKTLEEAIAQVEIDLEEALVEEEKEKIKLEENEKEKEEERKIRQEQDERGRMVANNEYERRQKKQPNKKGKNKNNKKEKGLISSRKKEEPKPIKGEEIESRKLQEITNKAKKRISLLKNKQIRKSIKFDKYLKLVNAAVQGLREAGVPAEMALNRGSHGYLTVGNQTLPLCVPHGGQNTLSASSAKGTLDTLLDAYFKLLGGMKEDQSKAE